MKITAVRATPVNIPLEVPFLFAVGTYPGDTKVVIEVETDAGIVGLGEAPSPECAPVINQVLGPALEGFDPFDLQACERACVPDIQVMPNTDDSTVFRCFGGIEIALWDIRGKAFGLPLYMLLGGAFRKAIPFAEYFAFRQRRGDIGGERNADDIADYCARMKDKHGSTFFEGKLQLGDPDLEIRSVRAIRKAIGEDCLLRLDGNMSWSLPTARRILAEIEPCNIRNYEDPVASAEDMAKLRQHSAISFSTHTVDLPRAVRLGVPDFFVTNLSVLGGIARATRFIAACEKMGVGFWTFSGETGIGIAAYLHLIAATPWIREPGQCILHWQTDDVIEDGPFCPKHNVVAVPEGPGLGVTLSPSRLKRCHERFLAEGPYNYFRDPDAPRQYRRLPMH
ncbi:MAG TPA: mandelate racemase/muconate lactonizing enzyme family protein [Pseudolabrys sp.]|nr:mandelate racemase/muconate lactonizing enzyme family protein [Pseudolabrys sp.]